MSAPPTPEDGVMEAVPFLTGRTMTPEEVQQLMQRTVQQVRLSPLPSDGERGWSLTPSLSAPPPF